MRRVVGHDIVSHEWIDRHVLRDQQAGGDLYRYPRHRCKRYRKRYGVKDGRGRIPGRVEIEQRPTNVDERSRIGDWEGDTLVGKDRRNSIASLVERKSLYRLLRKVGRLTEAPVTEAIEVKLKGETAFTLTLDNGKEFAGHKRLTSNLNGWAAYFADPYCAWQRARNENIHAWPRATIPTQGDGLSPSQRPGDRTDRMAAQQPALEILGILNALRGKPQSR